LHQILTLVVLASLLGCGGRQRGSSSDNCTSNADCPAGEVCNACARSSCDKCDDCIPGCIPDRDTTETTGALVPAAFMTCQLDAAADPSAL
jgi:hypothetical protein